MNIFQVTKNSYEFTSEQLALLLQHIDNYRKTPEGSWLADIDYRQCKFMWAPALEDSFIMAANPMIGKSIYVRPEWGNPDYWVSLITPSVVHELRHKWQIQKYGILLYSISTVLSRIFLLFSEDMYSRTLMEKQAFKDEDNIRELIGGI